MNVNHKRLLELLNYNKSTGVFTWRVARNGHVRAGRRWSARANIRGVYQHLGMFDTTEEASETYKKVTLAAHGEYANQRL
jgi:hypothetical protein